MEIRTIPLDEVPQVLADASAALQIATWPEAAEASGDEPPAYAIKRPGALAFFALDAKGQLLGYAEIFPRTIFTEEGSMDIWGLGSVCVTKASQGQGIGRKVVEACFQEVDRKQGVSLFQTGVPGFYQKLNCEEVDNSFVNKLDEQHPESNPFWDDHIMIYPKGYAWPKGQIDLNGKGY